MGVAAQHEATPPGGILALGGLVDLVADRFGPAVATCPPHEAVVRARGARLVLMSVARLEELALLRAVLEAAPDVPVIVAADAPFARDALRHGAFAVLPAAPRPAELARALRELDVEREDSR